MRTLGALLISSGVVLFVQMWMFAATNTTSSNNNDPMHENSMSEPSFLRTTKINCASVESEGTSRNNSAVMLTPPLFNPQKDLHFANDTTTPFSRHRCVTTSMSGEFPDYIGRTCLFQNLYFSHEHLQFYYYTSPLERKVKGDQGLVEEISVAGGMVLGSGNESLKWYRRKMRFSPVPVDNLPRNESSRDVVVVTNDADFVLYKPSYSFNLGHFVFDDVLSIFTMLEFFGKSERQFVPFFLQEPNDPYFRCHPAFRWKACLKSWSRFMPSLLGVENLIMTKWWLGESMYNKTAGLVRIPSLIVGQGKIANFACEGECGLHRAPTIRRFRSWLIKHILAGTSDEKLPLLKKGKILVSLPVGNSHKGIEWFERIIPSLNSTFGEAAITVVDLATIPMIEQAKLVASSNVFLTNMGGGSAVSLFLNEGATAIIFDRYPEEHRYDSLLYDTNGYFRVHWIRSGSAPSSVVEAVKLAIEQTS